MGKTKKVLIIMQHDENLGGNRHGICADGTKIL